MLIRFLKRQPKLLRQLESLLILMLIGWVDIMTGYQASLSVFYAIPIMLAAWWCDRRTPFALAALAAVVWSLADVAAGHQYFSGTLHAWEISIRSAFFFAVAIAGVALKDGRDAANARMELLEHSRRLEQQITQITEYEQQRIGRELHDGLCQYLAAVSCAMTSLKIDIERSGQQQLTELAAQIETLLAESVNQARDLARGLAPVQEDETGLAAALQELSAATSRRLGLECTFESAGQSPIAHNGKATYLYRIAQEAIENAAKHGKAQAIDVRLSANPSAVSLSIADDGIGFSKTEKNMNGIGIRVMQHRANVIGGELQIEEGPGGGTIVSCTVPGARIGVT